MTSPSSILVPDHCVWKGQHSTFDDSWTLSYLPGAWEKFAGNVTISIINLSHMCAYSAILRLKIINNKSIEVIELDTTWHLGKGGTEWDNPPHRFQTGWCWSPISGSYLGYWVCQIYIYIYIYISVCEWSDRYGYILYIFASGGGWRLPVKHYFFSFFLFPTVNIV